MNYGYFEIGKNLDLNPTEEKNRYAIQLYHELASTVEIKDKDILEIAIGRGGGINYISKQFSPKTVTGLELNEKAIKFCTENYKNSAIHFIQGNAESLPLKDNSFDAVINIESCHGYPHFNKFLSEVYRVLKPGSYFLLADFRPKSELPSVKSELLKAKFIIISERIITENVVAALDLIHADRAAQVNRLVPTILRGMSRNFAGLKGSPIYNKFVKREFEYVMYLAQK